MTESDAGFLDAQQQALAPLVVAHFDLYKDLRARLDDESRPDEEVYGEALAATNELGLILQRLRRREDLVEAHAQTDGAQPIPLAAIDLLYHSLLLLAGPPVDEHEADALFPVATLAAILFVNPEPVRSWLESRGVEIDIPVAPPPPSPPARPGTRRRLRGAR